MKPAIFFILSVLALEAIASEPPTQALEINQGDKSTIEKAKTSESLNANVGPLADRRLRYGAYVHPGFGLPLGGPSRIHLGLPHHSAAKAEKKITILAPMDVVFNFEGFVHAGNANRQGLSTSNSDSVSGNEKQALSYDARDLDASVDHLKSGEIRPPVLPYRLGYVDQPYEQKRYPVYRRGQRGQRAPAQKVHSYEN